MKNLRPLVRYFLMMPLFFFIGLGTMQAQSGCTTGWSTTAGAPIAGTINVPTQLGGGIAEYVEVDIFLDANCYKRFNVSVTPFEADCSIIEYYNSSGQLVGVEDQNQPGSSTFIFNSSDLNGTPGNGGYPSGVADNPPFCDLVGSTTGSTASDGIRGDLPIANDDHRNEGYSPDYMCDYEPVTCIVGAEAGQFYYFRSVQDLNTNANGQNNAGINDGYHFFDGLSRNTGNTYRAIFIRSVTDGSGPIMTGSVNTLCISGTPFDNCPTPLVGDPRSTSNLTHDPNNDGTISDGIITDNDPLASNATSSTGSGLIALGVDQVRAITCAELPTSLATQPYTGGLTLVYGTEPTDVATIDYGTGFIDEDANGNGISDATEGLAAIIPGYLLSTSNLSYNGVTDVATTSFAGGNGGIVTNAAPDGCGTAVNVNFLDLQDFSKRGNIYDNYSLAVANTTDFTTATFGSGQDGRFRYCYSINRTWTATDAAGNDANCTQAIDVIDDFHAYAVNGSTTDITKAGSPYFEAVGTVNVSPTALSSSPSPTNTTTMLYGTALPYFPISNFGFTSVEYSPGYDLTVGAVPNASGAQGYEFPVFIYDESVDAFDCTELTTLDGFAPSAEDNCGVLRVDPIESLFDYGLDGDFGDDGSAVFSTSPLIPQTYAFNNDLTTPAYELESAITTGSSSSTNDDDDLGVSSNPFSCSFYEYDLLKRWRVVDNCGFQSIAQRIYHIRDREAPTISSTSITVSGSPIVYAVNLVGEVASSLNAPNVRTYEINTSNPINIVSNDCMPILDISSTLLDNCAANPYLNISYAITSLNSNGFSIPVGSGNLVNGNTMVPLPINGAYVVTISYSDPCGNISKLEVDVTTTQTDNQLNYNSLFNAQIGTTGSGTIDFLDIVTPSEIQNYLTNLCTLPSCVELVIKGTSASGAVMEDRGYYQVDQSNATLIGFAPNNDPALILSCDDIGQVNRTIAIEIYEESNCNFTTNPVSTNTGSLSNLLINTNPGDITVTSTGPGTLPFSVATSSVPASSASPNSGSIDVMITPGSTTPTQLYEIAYTGTSSGTITGINLANSNPTTISGLSSGTYNITVKGQTSCLTETTTVTLGTGVAATTRLEGPATLTSGVTNFTLFAESGFDNITSLSLQIVLTGPTGTVLSDANMVSPLSTAVSSVGGLFGWAEDSGLPNTYNVLVSVPFGETISIADGEALISFQVDIPATAAVGDVVAMNVTGSVLQTTTFGSSSISIPFVGDSYSMSISSSPLGTLGASGQVVYMYCSLPVENVQISLDDTNQTQTRFTNTTGSYSFSSNIPVGSAVTLTPTLTSLNSSSSSYMIDGGDLTVLLGLLLTTPPTNPYQLVAADINGDGFLDAADAILLLNNITTSNLAFLNSWIFVNANQSLNSFTPTAANLLETSFTTSNFASSASIDFIAVKPGDVKEECTFGSGVVIRGVTPMVVKDRAISKGESYELDFSLRDFEQIKAFQTVLNFDPTIVKPTEVVVSEKLKAAGLTNVIIEESSIRLIGAAAEAVDLTNEDALISVRFEAVKSARSLKTAFTVNSDNPSLIFNEDTDRHSLILLFDSKDTKTNALEVYGSSPNPFNTTTSIQFGLSESDRVQLTVTDITGRVVYESNELLDAGQHQIELTADDLNTTGVLIYTISTSNSKHSDKLLLIK